MTYYIFSVVLLLIALVAIELRKSYHEVTSDELKYRAKQGDKLAQRIYSAVSYEDSLEALLWLVITLCITGSFILFKEVAPTWLSFIALAIFLWVALAWLPKLRVNGLSDKLVVFISPAIVWVLNYMHPALNTLNKFILKSKSQFHTGIYDERSLIALLDKQKDQQDNRISPEKLELIKNSLNLSNKTVSEYCQNWSSIKSVTENETIGPILLDELHGSGQQYIPVVNYDKDEVVGLVDLNRVNITSTLAIKDIMDDQVEYINEDNSLEDALNKMSSTNCPVYVVTDKVNRPFGMITTSDVISQLVSQAPQVTETEPEVIEPELDEDVPQDTEIA